MSKRKLTITLQSDWKSALRSMAGKASAQDYQGETLNFETPGSFFGQLTERRWQLVRTLQEADGKVGVRELARRLGRDVKRVHEDASALVALGLLERDETGALICPYVDIHVDMHLAAAA
ncbi:MAG: hypothetical protein ACLGII_02485 [Gammaproteobacteria bacterium]|jgi:predicted transcriptional regulator